MLSTNDFVSVDEIIADAVGNVGDDRLKMRGRGYYVGLVHRAVEAFALDSFYQSITQDIPNFNPDDALPVQYPVPPNAFNIKRIYLFNGDCNATIAPTGGSNNLFTDSFVIVHWKPSFNSSGASKKVTAKIKNLNDDTVYAGGDLSRSWSVRNFSNLYIYNIQSGLIMFSDNASSFSHLRLEYSGMGSDNAELPSVPRVFRDAIVDMVTERACFSLKIDDRKYAPHYRDAYLRLYGDGRMNMGSYQRAKNISRSLDTKARNDWREYMANPTTR